MSPEISSVCPDASGVPATVPVNAVVADRLREMALRLQAQGDDNPFRVMAYRRAADTVAHWPHTMQAILQDRGLEGLDALPGIGSGIAAAIAEIVQTGRWARLDRLRGTAEPEVLFRSVPGIGNQLALQIHDELGIETLEALETAAYDGRLEALPGMGVRRAAAIRAALTQRLDHTRRARHASRVAHWRTRPLGVRTRLTSVERCCRSAGSCVFLRRLIDPAQ